MQPWSTGQLGLPDAVALTAWFAVKVERDADVPRPGARDFWRRFPKFILAFVSIGLEFEVKSLREAGVRPVAVFGLATVFNLVLGLLLASVLFGSFEV